MIQVDPFWSSRGPSIDAPRRWRSSRTFSTTSPWVLSQLVRRLDVEAARFRQRLERLHATDVRAREKMRERLFGKQGNELLGLAPALLCERTEVVWLAPLLSMAGLRVPDQVERCRHSVDVTRASSSRSRA